MTNGNGKKPKPKLTAKQQRFCEEYMIDFNATAAALRAGYAKDTAYAIGAENLKKPQIKAGLEEQKKLMRERAHVEAEWVLQKYLKIANTKVEDLFTIGETGELQMLPFDQWPPGASEAVESIQQDRVIREMHGSEKTATMVVHDKVKIKLWNIHPAIEMISRWTGGFVETKKRQVEGQVLHKIEAYKKFTDLMKAAESQKNQSVTKNRIKQHLGVSSDDGNGSK